MKIFIKIILCCVFLFASSVFGQEAQKIDEFGNTNCEGYLASMDNFLLVLNSSPDSKGYVLVYEGKLSEQKYDSNGKNIGNIESLPMAGLAKAKIKSIKQFLKIRKIPLEKVVFIEAGFLENFKVEFWNVPSDAKPPIPTPTLKKIKFRKGKAKGFCTGCY